MKLSDLALLGALMCLPSIATAQFTGGDADVKITTVKEFLDKAEFEPSGGLSGLIDAGVNAAQTDDMKFVMEGYIVAQLDNDAYQFRDSTGTMNVEIDDFRGVEVSPEDRVRLFGEADYDDGVVFLEVDRLELVEP